MDPASNFLMSAFMFPFISYKQAFKALSHLGICKKGADPFHVAADPDKDSEAISLAAAQAKKWRS